jgi:hypothetical protein|tara:strand:- start:203 stop:511 length:309 start_codon:yes stop_codon:yes gene_type:complete
MSKTKITIGSAFSSVKNHFKESYRLSKVAFYSELCEAVLVGGASAILTFTVLDPATKIFIPMYFIGSALGVISTVIRKASFATVLTGWFTIMNFIALIKLFG